MAIDHPPTPRVVKRRLTLTRSGKLMGVMALLTLVPAYGLSVTLMFLMGALLLGLLFYNFLAVVRSLRKLEPRLGHMGELFAEREGNVHFLLELQRRRGRIHNLHLEVHGENLEDTEAIIASLDAGEPQDVGVPIYPQHRGWAKLTHCTLTVAHPFGLVRASREFPLNQRILIYPSLLRTGGRALFADQETEGMVPKSSDDFVYLAPYQPGEDVRRIHWKKSTLTEQPVLRKDLAQVEVVVPRLFVPDPCPHFEYALSVMATHFAREHHLTGWEVLTRDGLVRARSREEMLHLLALIQPITTSAEAYEAMGHSIIYASQITPEKS